MLFTTDPVGLNDGDTNIDGGPEEWNFVSHDLRAFWFYAQEFYRNGRFFEPRTERMLMTASPGRLDAILCNKHKSLSLGKINLVVHSASDSALVPDWKIGVVTCIRKFRPEVGESLRYLIESTFGYLFQGELDGRWSTYSEEVLFDAYAPSADGDSEREDGLEAIGVQRKVILHALDLFPGDASEAYSWMHEDMVQLEGKAPSELVSDDEYLLLLDTIGRLEHNVVK